MKYIIFIKRSRSGSTYKAYLWMKENKSHPKEDVIAYFNKCKDMWKTRNSVHLVDATSLKEAKKKAVIEKFGKK